MGAHVGKILEFIPKKPTQLGFEKVKKRKKTRGLAPGQLNLFSGTAQVLRMPSTSGPFEEALLLDERGDARAEEAYRRAIEQGDDLADSYCNLGIILSRRGEMTKAFDCFTKSLEQNPRHFESQYNLGNLYFERDNYRLARMHYEIAAEIQPEHAGVYFNLGLALALSDDLSAALNALEKYKSLAAKDESDKADDLLANLQRIVSSPR